MHSNKKKTATKLLKIKHFQSFYIIVWIQNIQKKLKISNHTKISPISSEKNQPTIIVEIYEYIIQTNKIIDKNKNT